MFNDIAQIRAFRRGVVHTTLNPEKPGAVRIHLIPPRWNPLRDSSYTLILNGYWLLPVGYSWAVLLSNFIDEVNKFDGRTMKKKDMANAAEAAVERTRRVYIFTSKDRLRSDLNEILSVLFDIARGRTPKTTIEALSLRQYTRNMTAPHRMDLMVSAMTDSDGCWNCNLKCRHCYAAGQQEAHCSELTTEEWKSIIDNCRKSGIPQLTFTGGEPTMRSDLVELIAYAKWHVTRLNTNGILLSAELCKELKAASLDAAQVTLYSSDSKIHDMLVGCEGAWEQSVAGLKNALAAGLNVSVNTPICRDNSDYVSTLAFLHELGVQYVSCSGLIETGKASTSAQCTVKEIDDILRQAAAFCAANDMEISFTSPGRASTDVLRELGITVPMCGACLSNMAIAPDGSVMPCQSWLSSDAVLGNMLTDKWKNIWNSKFCRSIRTMPEDDSMFCPLRRSEGRVSK